MKMAWINKKDQEWFDQLSRDIGRTFRFTPLLSATLCDVKQGIHSCISYWSITPLLYFWTKYIGPLGQKDSTVPILNYWPDLDYIESLCE